MCKKVEKQISEKNVKKVDKMKEIQQTAEQQQIISELKRRGYQYISDIGKGSFAKVVRVWDSQENCCFACKVSVSCDMAEREAGMLQELQYPLFPAYRESWKCGNKHYILMEDIAGSNVRVLLRRRGHFSQRQAVRITLALAQGLMFLHERSEPILFRDIKPDNVMLRQDGRVKLVDVGCACRKAEMGTIAGSRGYGAPEQFERGGSIGEESDVYALGKLLLYLLTGEELVGFAELLHKKREYQKRIAPGLLQLVAQAIQTEPSKRIPDMRTFLEKLAVYEGRMPWKRFCTDIKACLCGCVSADFYYIQNVRKGMDDHVS